MQTFNIKELQLHGGNKMKYSRFHPSLLQSKLLEKVVGEAWARNWRKIEFKINKDTLKCLESCKKSTLQGIVFCFNHPKLETALIMHSYTWLARWFVAGGFLQYGCGYIFTGIISQQGKVWLYEGWTLENVQCHKI